MTSIGTISPASWGMSAPRLFWKGATGLSTLVCLFSAAHAYMQWQSGKILLKEAPIDRNSQLSAQKAIRELSPRSEQATLEDYRSLLTKIPERIKTDNPCDTVKAALHSLLFSTEQILKKTDEEPSVPASTLLDLDKHRELCIRRLKLFENNCNTLLSKDLKTVNIPYKPIAVGILGFVGMVYSTLKYLST